ncbi:MAG TPA: penicillin acylase family protein [Pyrinomonadaceae bacterium]|nr:penicillin acylase family protein [Pyrinomonadaceae bacterium]
MSIQWQGKSSVRYWFGSMALAGLCLLANNAPARPAAAGELWREVEVVRTAHGVPHIRARNLRAAGYALAWVQCEDYGTATPMAVLSASGRWASVGGYERIETDFLYGRHRPGTLAKYPSLSKDVRDVYEGFAAGVNRYISEHASDFPPNMPADFTGQDVAAVEIVTLSPRKVRAFLNRLAPTPTPTPQTTAAGSAATAAVESGDGNDGSNAWAFAPSRTRSGRAILLRNPHLAWTAGYYEAHMTVPGVVDFYGDFRIGGPFSVIGGFNRDLGWSTTNNEADLDEIYALDVDPRAADRYLLDGVSHPMKRELLTAEFRNGEGLSSETREVWSTPLGPVIHRDGGKIYVFKFAGDGEIRGGEQFLKMMRSRSIAEWKEAMKMRARMTSNFTYADRAGNIYLIWNATLPLLPHPPGEDTVALPARKSTDIWTRYVPFEELPQVLNPPGGYVHNENSSPHYTNIRAKVDIRNAYPNFEKPELSLRSQLALQLIGGDEKFSLEDVLRLKNNYRMLTAERVKPDLIAAVKATNPTGDVASALALLEKWDNTASPESRGSTLFEEWWATYSGLRRPERVMLPNERRFAKVWTADDPFNTPRGLADPTRAVESFTQAVAEVKRRYGSLDVTWGEVHRVRRGAVDVPVGGCGNDLGCFRVLGFARSGDGKLAANGGDGWVLAVEFGDTPRAYSVLGYGQSSLPASPWHADQVEMFARGEFKKVAFTESDVNAQAVRRYRPGQP